MPLPTSWVDALFARMTLRYGAAFMRQYGDADPALVKADWADVLDGLRGEAIGYALRYLPVEPCTAMRFRDLARAAPPPALPAITDDTRADPARVQAALAQMTRPANDAGKTPAHYCAEQILAIAQQRGRMSTPQRQQLAAMAALLTPQHRADAERWIPGIAPRDAAEVIAS